MGWRETAKTAYRTLAAQGFEKTDLLRGERIGVRGNISCSLIMRSFKHLLRGERIGVRGNTTEAVAEKINIANLLRGERIGVRGNLCGNSPLGLFLFLLRGERIGVRGNLAVHGSSAWTLNLAKG